MKTKAFLIKTLSLVCLLTSLESATLASEITAPKSLENVLTEARNADGTKGGECPGATCSFVLQRMEARKTQGLVGDGSLQILVAILFSQNISFGRLSGGPVPVDFRLTYNTETDLFSTNIPNPGLKTFDELGVWGGLNMSLFKKNLEILLPQIKDDIRKIPNNPNLIVGDVAVYIQLSLLST